MSDQPDLPHEGFRLSDKRPAAVVDLREYRQSRDSLPTTFQRRELDAILWIYGKMVGDGEWRDYAIDHLKERAVFSVFKRAGEIPLYRIEKTPALAARQGAFSVSTGAGLVLKRGHELRQVLKVFDKAMKLVD